MPSCVVKCCKNNSTSQKKGQGITFHRFHPGNEPWNNDWIDIIRYCRSEADWIPSKSSVICSVHFEEKDLYITKNGQRRVIDYAVPRLLLFGPQKQGQPAEPRTSRTLRRRVPRRCQSSFDPSGSPSLPLPQTPPIIRAVATDSEQHSSSFEPSDAPSASLPLLQTTPSIVSVATDSEQPSSSFEPFGAPCPSLTSHQITSSIVAVTTDSEQPSSSLELSGAPSPYLPLSHTTPSIVPVATDSKQPSSSFQHFGAPSPSLNLPQTTPSNIAVATDSEQPSSFHSSNTLSPNLPLPHAPPSIGTVATDTELSSSFEPPGSPGPSLPLLQTLTVIEGVSVNFEQQYDTPRKHLMDELKNKKALIVNYKKKIKTLNQKIRRLEDRNKSLKYILKNLKKRNYIDTDLFSKLNQNIAAVDLFNYYNRKRLKKQIVYSPAIKKFCVTLNYYSPKAYDYIRQTFGTCLPHRKTLGKWYSHVKREPGAQTDKSTTRPEVIDTTNQPISVNSDLTEDSSAADILMALDNYSAHQA